MLESEFFGKFLELVTDESRTVIRSQDRGDALLGEQVLELLDNGVALTGAQFEHEWVLELCRSSNRLLRGTLH